MSASEIILERLKTHPEEFVSLSDDVAIDGKWSPLLQTLTDWATVEELNSITEGMTQAKRLLADQIALQILSGEYIQPPTLKYEHPYNKSHQQLIDKETKAQMLKALEEYKARGKI